MDSHIEIKDSELGLRTQLKPEFSSALSYLINFILDATLGMLLIWLGVKVVSWMVHRKKYTYLVFGEYGRCLLLCTKVACLLPALNEEKKMAETAIWGENT